MVGLANDRALRGKIGAAVVAVRRAGATHVFDSINHMFLSRGLHGWHDRSDRLGR
jgi:hypothetical protein